MSFVVVIQRAGEPGCVTSTRQLMVLLKEKYPTDVLIQSAVKALDHFTGHHIKWGKLSDNVIDMILALIAQKDAELFAEVTKNMAEMHEQFVKQENEELAKQPNNDPSVEEQILEVFFPARGEKERGN